MSYSDIPENPNGNAAALGKDILYYINIGAAAVPVWLLVGGQTKSTLSRSADTVDASDKTSGGWKVTLPGLKSWSLDLEGLILMNNDALGYLEYAFQNGKELNVKTEYSDGSYQTGWGSLTDFKFEAPKDDVATLSGTISGDGALSARTPTVSPTTATVSLAKAADKTFAFTPDTTTITSVLNGSTTLTSGTNYSYASGVLTLKSTYLSTLTAGTHIFTVNTGTGATITVTVTITA